MSSVLVQVPQVAIELGGQRLDQDALRGLTEVRVQQRLSMPTLCELNFSDPPGPRDILNALVPTTPLWVGVGDRQVDAAPLFVGEVTAVEHIYGPDGAYEVRVRGYDRLHQMRQHHHLRAFEEVTVDDVTRQVARDYGLGMKSAAPNLKWPVLIQHHQSDLELLVEISARCGCHLVLRGDTLHLITLDGIGPAIGLALGESLLEARLELNSDLSRHTVTTSGWDPLQADFQTQVEAKRKHSAQQFRRRDTTAHHLVNEGTVDVAHARALAQADIDFRSTHEATLWGMARGNPDLKVGGRVDLEGVTPAMEGRYVLTEVIHRINNQSGFVSEISSMPPAPRPRARGVTATVGVVTNVLDPLGRGRVRVRLPAYGDVKTDWMGVMTAGAGHRKGLLIPPEKGDTVLALLFQEDPGQGIVVGGLYGRQRVPDSGVNLLGQVRRYTWRTPGGQQIQLDDTGDTIHLENDAGSYIELSGGKVVIAGSSIDFRKR